MKLRPTIVWGNATIKPGIKRLEWTNTMWDDRCKKKRGLGLKLELSRRIGALITSFTNQISSKRKY
jgi:hypothetical protein